MEEILQRQGLGGMPGLGSDIPYTPIFPNVPAVPNL
jgi:hypothetical protein